jgi:hypothetical protein
LRPRNHLVIRKKHISLLFTIAVTPSIDFLLDCLLVFAPFFFFFFKTSHSDIFWQLPFGTYVATRQGWVVTAFDGGDLPPKIDTNQSGIYFRPDPIGTTYVAAIERDVSQ